MAKAAIVVPVVEITAMTKLFNIDTFGEEPFQFDPGLDDEIVHTLQTKGSISVNPDSCFEAYDW